MLETAYRLWGVAAPDAPEIARAASTRTYLDGIRTPTLLLCGAHDLPFALSSRILLDDLRARGVPCALRVFLGEGHALGREARIHALQTPKSAGWPPWGARRGAPARLTCHA